MATTLEREQQKKPLRVETLGIGMSNINTDYPIPETITFIKDLGIGLTIHTNEKRLGIVDKITETKESDSLIYITDKIGESKRRAGGTRQVIYPLVYYAATSIRNEEMITSQSKIIILCTKYPRSEIESMIKEIIGEIPDNWQFNPRTTPVPKQRV